MGDNKKRPVGKQLLTAALSAGILVTQTAPILAADTDVNDSTPTALDLMSEETSSNKVGKLKEYEKNDVVTFIVELETEPVYLQSSKARSAISQAVLKKGLIAEHDAIRSEIRKEIGSKQRSAAIVSEYDYTTVFNGFTLETTYDNLEKIANINGVKRVFVSEEQQLVEPTMKSSSEMVGANIAWASEFTGKGTKVAVLDTGLDLKHEAFQAAPKDAAETENDIEKLFDTTVFQAKKYVGKTTAADVYHNEKVPFQFDYADKDANVSPESDATAATVDHGTHVAGTVGGFIVAEEGAVKFSGIAPDAQLCIMKVFSDKGGGAYDHNIMAALEDAVNLNVDTINMSLGSPAGYSETRNTALNEVYKRVSNKGIDLMIAAGNEYDSARGNGSGYDLASATNPDRGIVGSPSTFASSTSVASINNTKLTLPALKTNGRDMGYTQTSILMKKLIPSDKDIVELPYVFIPNVGKVEDFAGKDVKNKLALIQRGEIAFTEKINNAAAAGAVGVIIFDNVDGAMLTMSSEGTNIPSCFITKADGEFLHNAGNSTLSISKGDAQFVNSVGSEMSDFSSLGVTPDLKLKPEVTAPGGAIYSSLPVAMGSYGSMDGTSMATPHMAGMSAIVRQHVRESYPGLSAQQERDLIDQLLMSTATPVTQKANSVYYSPRKQGSGLANVNSAVTSEAYISVTPDEDGNVRPKINLGDDVDKTGEYTLTFKVNNMSNSSQTYRARTTVLIDGLAQDEAGTLYIAKEEAQLMNNEDVVISTINETQSNEISVAAHNSADVTIQVTLTEAGKIKLENFENGDFIEGFVEMIPVNHANNDIALTIPFMGFYGNWAQAPILEEGTWYDNTGEYMTYPLEVSVNIRENETLLGSNYLNDKAAFNKDVFALSPDDNGYGDKISSINFGMLRNADKVEYTVEDSDGNVVFKDSAAQMFKSVWKADDNMIFPSSAYTGNFPIKAFDAKDSGGNILPDGNYTYKIKATIDYDHTDGNVRDTYEIPFIIDTQLPTASNVRIVREGDKLFLKGTMKENNALMSTGVIKDQIFAYDTFNDGTNTVNFKYDVTSYEGQTITLYGVDYAYNEFDYEVQVIAPVKETATAKEILASSIIKAQNLIDNNMLNHLNNKVMALFNARLNQAVSVYKNAASTNEQLTSAWNNLAAAMHYLDFTANTSQLQTLVDECIALNLNNYIDDENMVNFKEALENAQTTLADENALDLRLSEAYESLITAKSHLKLVEGQIDTIVIDFLISKGNAVLENEEKYDTSADSWAVFTSAFNNAKQAKLDLVSQKAIDEAAMKLASAYENIRLIANENTLKELANYVTMIDEVNANDYSSETMAFFMQTRAAVQTLMNFESFTMKQYEEVLSLVAEVQVRIERDKLVPEEPSIPEEPTNPSEPTQPGEVPTQPVTPEEPTQPSTPVEPSVKEPVKGTIKPATGDATQSGILVGGFITAGFAAIATIWKRRKH